MSSGCVLRCSCLPTPSSGVFESDQEDDGVPNNRIVVTTAAPGDDKINSGGSNRLLSDLWSQLCGWEKRDLEADDAQLLIDTLKKFIQIAVLNSGGDGDKTRRRRRRKRGDSNLVLPPCERGNPGATGTKKITHKEEQSDYTVKQVIFVQVPEDGQEGGGGRAHDTAPPETVIYVLPPKEENHFFRFIDMRDGGDERARHLTLPPTVNFLSQR